MPYTVYPTPRFKCHHFGPMVSSSWGLRTFYVELLVFIRNHFFISNGKLYRQKQIMAVLAACAPAYTCLVLGWWQQISVYGMCGFDKQVLCIRCEHYHFWEAPGRKYPASRHQYPSMTRFGLRPSSKA